jgi:hypothetical protein
LNIIVIFALFRVYSAALLVMTLIIQSEGGGEVTVDKIVTKIRERYACGWELGFEAAQKLILDFAKKRAEYELKRYKSEAKREKGD